MNLTHNNLEGIKREEGQKQLLERNLEAHRSRKWIINFICAISLLVAILCICFHVPRSLIITVILLFICTIIKIVYKTLDKKIELRLKRVKQEQRKSIFKINRS
jgi:Flp pilus assembly protein TadB